MEELELQIQHIETKEIFNAETNDDGKFTFSKVPVGKYELTVTDAQKGIGGIYTCSVTNEIAPLLTLHRRPITLTFDKFASVSSFIKVTNEFKVYPNPARDFVAIEFNNSESKASIQILDLSGSKVMSLDVSNESLINIDISQFTNGYYNIVSSGY